MRRWGDRKAAEAPPVANLGALLHELGIETRELELSLGAASMIIVAGRVTARSDSLEALRSAALEHVMRSRAEPGCLCHGVAIDCEDPSTLVFFERWADRGALEVHLSQPGSAEFVRSVRALAAATSGLEIYKVIASD